MPRKLYDRQFYEEQQDASYSSAQIVVPIILNIFTPRSVVDVGCGVGGWLAVFKDLLPNIEVAGLDGNYVERELLRISENEFYSMDLSREIKINNKYELAMSLEVAEHLHENKAVQFVESLTHLSDLVLFSAAIPGQTGVNHINEQYPEYSSNLFSQKGYLCVDILRPIIWNDNQVAPYYRQNMLFFVKKSCLENYPIINSFYLNLYDYPPPKYCASVFYEGLRLNRISYSY